MSKEHNDYDAVRNDRLDDANAWLPQAKRLKTHHETNLRSTCTFGNTTITTVPPAPTPPPPIVNDDALLRAASDGRWDDCRAVLSRCDPRRAARLASYRDLRGDGRGPLHELCLRDDAPLDVVRAVVSRLDAADVARPNARGVSPLHWACSRASDEVVATLLDAAPTAASVADDRGTTPLHVAVSAGRRPDLVQRLAEARAAADGTSAEYHLENWHWSLY